MYPLLGARRPGGAKRQASVGAQWFYWIAGLSVLNSLLASAHAGIQFIFGLGITRLIDELRAAWLPDWSYLNVALSVAVAGVFVLIGWIAGKGYRAAYLVGLALYILDALIFIIFPRQIMWLPLLVHAYLSYRIVQGFLATRALQAAASPAPPTA
jgi:hypothetical protein